MNEMDVIKKIKNTYAILSPHLNEKAKRLWAACQARDVGWGGVSAVSNATGLSRVTIHLGLTDLEFPSDSDRIRKEGGGRKKITEKFPKLLHEVESLIEPLTRGDPESPLRWTCKSTRKLADELSKKKYVVTQRTICDLLDDLGYLRVPFSLPQFFLLATAKFIFSFTRSAARFFQSSDRALNFA